MTNVQKVPRTPFVSCTLKPGSYKCLPPQRFTACDHRTEAKLLNDTGRANRAGRVENAQPKSHVFFLRRPAEHNISDESGHYARFVAPKFAIIHRSRTKSVVKCLNGCPLNMCV
uniref:Uncharacterized protein n=1 Tax=Sipha flava TaxID=143950 RepID=A0A2S2PZ89_9HEMI